MSFPRYPAYKDSGVEWLGEVPGHWGAAPLKTVSTHKDDVLDESTAPETEIAYVDISSVDSVNGIRAKEDMLFAVAPSRARRRVKHGDVIVSTVRTHLKAIARIRNPEENLVVSTGFVVIRPRGDLAPDFLGHLVSAGFFVDQVIARSTGVSYPAINASELVAIPVPVPPLSEQTQIATFLDRETAKIDALVAEQRRLMALLKEKRQAVISHAVTKGLNPDAPMKPSGVEWLGEVPAHWKVKRLRDVANLNPSKSEIASWARDSFVSFLPMSAIGESHMYGAGGQKRIPDDFVRNFATGFPPFTVQAAIAAFLDVELSKFDTLTAQAQRAIDLLQERRTALISAAVTG